ncbi:hypothetical protein Vadar_006364 [Vaccinium darrowii]|uniref:Uncharacterized protein n=1 Tax=Vaccinium darrowii TaxID=229202 RepID=A0ACB7YVI3_9ERIC|nr:hypothetical protein Vadar_006364 [Vaccinium darrowii]
MADYRSKPNHFRSQTFSYNSSSSSSYAYGDNNKQPNSKPNHSRSHSSSYAANYENQIVAVKDLKKAKRTSGSKSTWGLSDPEFQRKKRVASYKVYSVEGKVKGSLKKSFKWVKDRYTQVVYGWW